MIKQQIRRLEAILEKEIKKENPNEQTIEMAKMAINENKKKLAYWDSIREKKKQKKFIDIRKEGEK